MPDEKIICEVQKYICFYDIEHKFYYDSTIKENDWGEISEFSFDPVCGNLYKRDFICRTFHLQHS